MRPLLFFIAMVASLTAATPLFQGSFDNSNGGWSVLRGGAVTDSAVTYQNHKSMRVEAAAGGDVAVRSAPIPLTIGKRYELTGWIPTDKLAGRDLGPPPNAIGPWLTRRSMPV